MLTKSEAAVLRTLWQRGEATRGELVAQLKLSRPTVDRALRTLEAYRIIEQLGPRPSLEGRPAIAYALRPDARLLAGVDLELPWVNLVLTNLLGTSIAEHKLRLEGRLKDPASLLHQMGVKLQQWVSDCGQRWEDVAAVGIGVPGPVVRGEVSLLGVTLPTWLRVPVQEMLKRQLKTEVHVSHDVHLMALAEAERGGWRDEILLFLSLRPGLVGEVRFGASVLIRGEPYWGAHGNGGALYRAYVAAEELADLDEETRCRLIAKRLAERAVPAVTLFDPDRVVVEAEFMGTGALRLVEQFRERLLSALKGEFPGLLRVSLAKVGGFGVALGAALAAQRQLLRCPERLFDGKGGESRFQKPSV